jgi:RNA polymerase sigma factor (sigma-70 family)
MDDSGGSSSPVFAGASDRPRSAPARPARILPYLYRRHWPELVGHIRREWGSGPPDPEDAAQAAFAQYAALNDAERIDNPRAFLFRSARNFVIDEKRKEQVRQRSQSTLLAGQETADELDPLRVLVAKERVAILIKVLNDLPARHREVFLMYKIDGLIFTEIAKRFSMSPAWAKNVVTQTLIRLDRAVRMAEGK